MVEVKLIKAVDEDRYFIAEVCRKTIPLYNEIAPGFLKGKLKYLRSNYLKDMTYIQ